MKKNIFNYLVLVLLFIFCLTGCEDQPVVKEDTFVTNIRFSCPNFPLKLNSRNILPPEGNLDTDHFSLVANGPKGQSINKSSINENTLELKSLNKGDWTFTAKALNQFGKVLAIGTKTVNLSQSNQTVELEINTLPGHGNLSINFTWDSSQIDLNDNNCNLKINLKNQEGNEIDANLENINYKEGKALLTHTLVSGSYTINVILQYENEDLAGATEAIRIIENTTSNGIINLSLGLITSNFTIINSTGTPILGHITSVPQDETSTLLTFVPQELPSNISLDKLEYQWYNQGKAMSNETSSSCYIFPSSGIQRYDVIVSTPQIGSIGGATITVSYPME